MAVGDTKWYSNLMAASGGGLPPARAGLGLCSRTAEFDLSLAGLDLDTDDLIKMVPIPAGATILDVSVSIPTDGLDDVSAATWTVGDNDATDDWDRYITSQTTIGRNAGGVARLNNPVGLGYKFVADGSIDICITAGATTTGSVGKVYMTVLYTMDA